MHRCKVLVPGGGDGLVPMQVPVGYQTQTIEGEEQILVSVNDGWLECLLSLISHSGQKYQCVYEVRAGNEDGSDLKVTSKLVSMNSIADVFRDEIYGEFLEADPRHNFTIRNVETENQVTLDEHNFLICRGDVQGFIAEVQAIGLSEKVIELPTPHVHQFHDKFDDVEPLFIQALKDIN